MGHLSSSNMQQADEKPLTHPFEGVVFTTITALAVKLLNTARNEEKKLMIRARGKEKTRCEKNERKTTEILS